MATTSPDLIYSPDNTAGIDQLHTELATMAASVQTAFDTRVIKTYKWADNAARTAQTGMGAGDEGYQTDTDTGYRYDGTDWRTPSPHSSGFETFSATVISTTADIGSTATFPTLPYETTVELNFIGIGDANGAPSDRTLWVGFVTTGSGVTFTQSISSGEPATVGAGSSKGTVGNQAVLVIPSGVLATAKLRAIPSTAMRVASGMWRWVRNAT